MKEIKQKIINYLVETKGMDVKYCFDVILEKKNGKLRKAKHPRVFCSAIDQDQKFHFFVYHTKTRDLMENGERVASL